MNEQLSFFSTGSSQGPTGSSEPVPGATVTRSPLTGGDPDLVAGAAPGTARTRTLSRRPRHQEKLREIEVLSLEEQKAMILALTLESCANCKWVDLGSEVLACSRGLAAGTHVYCLNHRRA